MDCDCIAKKILKSTSGNTAYNEYLENTYRLVDIKSKVYKYKKRTPALVIDNQPSTSRGIIYGDDENRGNEGDINRQSESGDDDSNINNTTLASETSITTP